MGYSQSTKAVDRVLAQLKTLKAAATDVTWITADPTKLAYQLREAFKVIERFPERYNDYIGIRDKFMFRARPNKVTAELRVPASELQEPVTVEQFVKSINTLQITDVSSVIAIVGATLTNKNTDELYFPQAMLHVDDLLKLYRWSSVNGYNIIVGNGITLTKNDSGELAWKPQ